MRKQFYSSGNDILANPGLACGARRDPPRYANSPSLGAPIYLQKSPRARVVLSQSKHSGNDIFKRHYRLGCHLFIFPSARSSLEPKKFAPPLHALPSFFFSVAHSLNSNYRENRVSERARENHTPKATASIKGARARETIWLMVCAERILPYKFIWHILVYRVGCMNKLKERKARSSQERLYWMPGTEPALAFEANFNPRLLIIILRIWAPESIYIQGWKLWLIALLQKSPLHLTPLFTPVSKDCSCKHS